MTAYERRISDWSSDVCSSDLGQAAAQGVDFLGAVHFHHGRIQLGLVVAALFTQGLQPWRDLFPFGHRAIAGSRQRVEHQLEDRKSVVKGKSVSDSVDLGGRRIIKKKNPI